MTQNNLKLSKDLGDNGDQLSQKPIYIYHIPGVKVIDWLLAQLISVVA